MSSPSSRFGELFEVLSLSEENGEFLHRRLYRELRHAILAGRVRPGSRIPSSRALAKSLGISRNTVSAAMQQLTAEGYIKSIEGSGSFVADLADAARFKRSRALTSLRSATSPVIASDRIEMLSGASAALSALRYRFGSSPAPFRVGIPAIEEFPMALWRKTADRAHRRMPMSALADGDPAGLPRLRQAIMAYLRSARDIHCEMEQLLITSGSQHALDLIVRVATKPGDCVLMEDPGYICASGCFHSAGLRVRGLAVDAEGMSLPTPRFRAHPRLIYCTPSSQMPLGITMTRARREALLAYAERKQCWIIEDDYDGEYRYDSRPIPPLFGMARRGNVIYVGTFSKTMFPGLRIGFAILPLEMVDAIATMRFVTSWHPPALEQYALAGFIENGEFARHVRRSRARYRERAEALFDAGKRWLPPSHSILRPASGLSAVLTAPETEDHPGLMRKAEKAGIEIAPLGMFALDRMVYPGYLLGFAPFDPERLRRSVRQLGELL